MQYSEFLLGPFSFRILEQPPNENPLESIPKFWINLIESNYSNVEQTSNMWTYGFLALGVFFLVANIILMRQRAN
jgi:hypothetical protein